MKSWRRGSERKAHPPTLALSSRRPRGITHRGQARPGMQLRAAAVQDCWVGMLTVHLFTRTTRPGIVRSCHSHLPVQMRIRVRGHQTDRASCRNVLVQHVLAAHTLLSLRASGTARHDQRPHACAVEYPCARPSTDRTSCSTVLAHHVLVANALPNPPST